MWRVATLFAAFLTCVAVAAEAGKPLEVLLIAGGCCHDYATQTQILKKGIEARVRSHVTVAYSPDTSTKSNRARIATLGRIVHREFTRLAADGDRAVIEEVCDRVDPAGHPFLVERRRLTFRATDQTRSIDVDQEFVCPQPQGDAATVPVRIDDRKDSGLFHANPFASRQYDPALPDGTTTIEPGGVLRLHHRFLYHKGDEKAGGVDVWSKFEELYSRICERSMKPSVGGHGQSETPALDTFRNFPAGDRTDAYVTRFVLCDERLRLRRKPMILVNPPDRDMRVEKITALIPSRLRQRSRTALHTPPSSRSADNATCLRQLWKRLD